MKKKLFLALSVASLLNAQDLKTTIVEILNTNPIVLERLKNYNSTKEDITTAEAGFYPKIDISLGGGFEYTQRESNQNNPINDGKVISDIDKNFVSSLGTAVYQNSLTYTHNLFKGWETTYQVQQQENRTISAAFSYIQSANDTAFKAVEAYLEVVKQKDLLETAKENVQINEDILDKVQKLYDSGLTTLSEANKIKASLALAKSNMTVQENTVLDKVYAFQRILGRYLKPEEMETPTLNVALPASIEDAAQFSMDNNPSLLIEKYNVKLAQATYKEKKSPFYPSIDLQVSADMTNNISANLQQSNSVKAMLYLKYNIFNGFNDTATLQKSISQLHQEVQTKDKVRREVIEGLNLSWASNEKLGEQIEFLNQYKDFAKKTLDLYLKEYDLGRRSLLDLLSAQSDYTGSKKSSNQY
jgi:adhesin transport system outer membrane protein